MFKKKKKIEEEVLGSVGGEIEVTLSPLVVKCKQKDIEKTLKKINNKLIDELDNLGMFPLLKEVKFTIRVYANPDNELSAEDIEELKGCGKEFKKFVKEVFGAKVTEEQYNNTLKQLEKELKEKEINDL